MALRRVQKLARKFYFLQHPTGVMRTHPVLELYDESGRIRQRHGRSTPHAMHCSCEGFGAPCVCEVNDIPWRTWPYRHDVADDGERMIGLAMWAAPARWVLGVAV